MMEDIQLKCNKCRLDLKDFAYLTICGHIFCKGCGPDLWVEPSDENYQRICLACKSSLNGSNAITKNLLYRDVNLLCGLGPNAIASLTSKALRFWAYQISQEIERNSQAYASLANLDNQRKKHTEQIVVDSNTRIMSLKFKNSSLSQQVKSLESEKTKLVEDKTLLEDKLRDVTYKCNQAHELYEKLRNRSQTPNGATAGASNLPNKHQPILKKTNVATFEDLFTQATSSQRRRQSFDNNQSSNTQWDANRQRQQKPPAFSMPQNQPRNPAPNAANQAPPARTSGSGPRGTAIRPTDPPLRGQAAFGPGGAGPPSRTGHRAPSISSNFGYRSSLKPESGAPRYAPGMTEGDARAKRSSVHFDMSDDALEDSPERRAPNYLYGSFLKS
ncbi:MAG: hypothetical protein M1829_004560 [Trizodia sp. TS-e1964]|nr:MAG: hypothetical protein M1829_004560 [Trizodia sp. TS-e1964]